MLWVLVNYTEDRVVWEIDLSLVANSGNVV